MGRHNLLTTAKIAALLEMYRLEAKTVMQWMAENFKHSQVTQEILHSQGPLGYYRK